MNQASGIKKSLIALQSRMKENNVEQHIIIIPSKEKIKSKILGRGVKNLKTVFNDFYNRQGIDANNRIEINKKVRNHFKKDNKCFGQMMYFSVVNQKKILNTFKFNGKSIDVVQGNFLDMFEQSNLDKRILRAQKLL